MSQTPSSETNSASNSSTALTYNDADHKDVTLVSTNGRKFYVESYVLRAHR